MRSISSSFRSKLLYWIIFFLGCTSFPVLNVAGCLKIYDLLGFILMAYNFLSPVSRNQKKSTANILAFFMFIVVPISSYIYSIVFLEYPTGFFNRWAGNKLVSSAGIKMNYYAFPLFQILLLVMNYAVFVSLSNNNTIYENFGKVVKAAIAMGTLIACISIFSGQVYDFIPNLPSIIQNQPSLSNRSRGFSQEPSVYAFYQSWMTLFIFYSKHLYRKRTWYILFIINLSALLLSLSSTMVGLAIAILLVFVSTNENISKKKKTAVRILLFILISFIIVFALDLQETITTYFYDKVFIFLSGSSHDNTISSGASRAFHNGLGYKIFANNPLFGVGQGHSQYYMYLYEFKMGIRRWGEKINPLSTPLGITPLVMAEQGILGLTALLLFYFHIIKKLWVKRKQSNYHKMFLTGGLATFVFFFTLFPVYHVFIWAYLALGLGYIKYYDRLKFEENEMLNNKKLLPKPIKYIETSKI